MRLGLKPKIILSLMSILVLMLIAVLTGDYRDDFQRLRENILNGQMESVKTVSTLVDTVFDEARATAQSLTVDPVIQTFSVSQVASFLKEVNNFHPQYEEMALFDAGGNLVASSLSSQSISLPSITDEDYFQLAMSSKGPVVSGVHQSWISGNPVIFVASPVLDASGVARGVFVVGLNASLFREKLAQARLPEIDNILLFDGNAILAFALKQADLDWQNRSSPSFEPIRAALEGKESHIPSVRSPWGDERMVASGPTPSYGWVVVVTKPVSSVAGPMNSGLLTKALIGGGIVAIAGALYLLITEMMLVRPIDTVRYHLARFGKGYSKQRVEINTGDELQSLGEAFNTMAEQLQQRTAERETLLEEATNARRQLEVLAKVAERRASELESVISSIADGVAIFDAEGRLSKVNEGTRKILGMPIPLGQSYEGIPGYFNVRYLSGEPMKPEDNAIALALHGEVVTNSEIIARRVDTGTDVFASVSAAPVRDNVGNITGCVIILHDISSRIAAQHAAEEAERRARFLAETSAYFTSVRDRRQIIDFLVNRAIEVMGDFCSVFLLDESGQWLNLAALQNRNVEARDELRQILVAHPLRIGDWTVGRVAETRKPTLIRDVKKEPQQLYPRTPQDLDLAQRHRLVSQLAVPLIARGRLFGVFSAATTTPGWFLNESDLNFASELANRAAMAIDNARLYREVERQRTFLQTVLDNIPDGIAVLDAEGLTIRQTNLAFRRTFLPEKYWTCDLTGLIAIELAKERGWIFDQEMLQREAGENRPVLLPEFSAIDPQGKQTYWALAGIPFREPDEEAQRFLIVIVDITQQVEARKKIEEIDHQKDQFLSVVSHELRSPLTSAKGYAQMLIKKMSTEPERAEEVKRLDLIVAQVDRMASMIEELLDVSRIQMGRLSLRKSKFDLAQLLKETVDRLQITTDRHAINLFVESQVTVDADRSRIDQVVANLLTNAIKYSPSGGDIDVRLSKKDGFAEVSVRDHGVGIREEAKKYIFEQFYQAGAAQREGGLGLGLFICRGIVEQHGGKIWFESQEGKGSTFYFTLPLA